ncbi:MAG: hypothetical protein H6Q73_3065 [Firmicutes bacterium]|nr:hypothetical protein [Bacillota bacterium]
MPFFFFYIGGNMRKVLLIFIDGFGLGENNGKINPLVRFNPSIFQWLIGSPLSVAATPAFNSKACLVATDAKLGIAGLPQSATGQTAIFTGVNASAVMGRHIQGFPGPSLAKIIAEHGVLSKLRNNGFRVTSANAYTPRYMELVKARKRRHSVTTLTILGAGLKLRSVPELEAGQALNQDITNEMLPIVDVNDIPVISPALAGRRLANLAKDHNFTMFEYFQTDRCGHKMDWDKAEIITAVLAEFLTAVYETSENELLVVVTSDHGNFEDLSVKTHTYNPVPTIIWGPECRSVAANIKDLTDISSAITRYLEG